MPANTPTKPKVIRKDIQALRAFAVLAVVIYHLWPTRLVGGFTGVDIFFVISGFLMTGSVMRNLAPLIDKKAITPKAIWSLLANFYVRRIKRLIPAALTTILGILGLSLLTGNLNAIITNAKNSIAAATFWQNWLLAKDSVDYLQQDNSVVATQHFWSLSLEEQFYLIWPLLLSISAFITINIVVLHRKDKIRGLLLPVILFTLLSLGFGIWLTHENPTVAYYATPARIWQLMVGGIIALLPAIRNYDLKLLLPYIGITINLYSIFFVGIENFPGWIAILPTIGTAMIVWAGVDRPESKLSFDHILRWRPIQWIGDISYSVYLWHFPFIILLPVIIHQSLNGPYGRPMKLGIIVLTFIVAHLSYKLVEQPAQKLRVKNRYIYIGFFVASASVAGLSYGLQQQAQAKIDSSRSAMHQEAMDQNEKCFGARAVVNKDDCKNPYGEVNPAFVSVGQQDHFRDIIQDDKRRCDNFNPDNEDYHDPKYACIYGDESAKRSIVVIGDSHADQYINAFHDIGERYGYKIIQLSAIRCMGDVSEESSQHQKLCAERLDYVTKSKHLKDSDLVVISLLFRDYHANINNLLTSIRKSTTKPMALLHDNPFTTSEDLSDCYTTNTECDMPADKFSRKDFPPFTNLLAKSKKQKRKTYLLDIEDAFCDDANCYSAVGGVPVFFDTRDGNNNSHVTASYALSIAPLIEDKLLEHKLISKPLKSSK